jgi:hypothetical protein
MRTATLFRYSWENASLNPSQRQYPYCLAKAPVVEVHIHWSKNAYAIQPL